MAIKWLRGREPTLCEYASQRDDSRPGQSGADSSRFHATQSGVQFKTYEFFISRVFHLIFSDHIWLWVTEPVESETSDKRGLL